MSTTLHAELEAMRPALIRFAMLQLRNVSLADDVVQDALIAVLELAVCTGVHSLVVHGDSRIIIDDVLGAVPVRTSALGSLQMHARQLLAQFQSVSLVWIPRARNGIADALARRAQACHGPRAVSPVSPDDAGLPWQLAGP